MEGLIDMSKPNWVITPEDEVLWGEAVGYSVSAELLLSKNAVKGFVKAKSSPGSLIFIGLSSMQEQFDVATLISLL